MPGYKNTGAAMTACGGGGKVKGYERQVCRKMAPEEIDEDEKALIDQSRPLELLLTEVCFIHNLIPRLIEENLKTRNLKNLKKLKI